MGRKQLKLDDLEPSPYPPREILESVHIFHDFPLDRTGPQSITTSQHKIDMDPLPIYTEVPIHTANGSPQGIHKVPSSHPKQNKGNV